MKWTTQIALFTHNRALQKSRIAVKVQNWAMVRYQLAANEKISARIKKYEHMI